MNPSRVIKVINDTLGTHLDEVSTPTDVRFKVLGIDSLGFFNVLVELERLTGKKVPDSALDAIATISDLTNFFSDND